MTEAPILSDDLIRLVCQTLGLDSSDVSRIVLDLEQGQPITVYLGVFAGQWVNTLDWAKYLRGANVNDA